jgi:hypothetical protein
MTGGSVAAMAASIRSTATPIDVQRLGTVDYQAAWQLQRELARRTSRRRSGHPPAARAPIGVHRRPAHAARGAPHRQHARRRHRSRWQRSPGTGQASWSGIRSSASSSHSMW